MDQLGELCKAAREPYWDELPIEKKIEEVKEAISRLMNLSEQTEILVERLSEHSHLDGRILVPFSSKTRERGGRRRLFNERSK